MIKTAIPKADKDARWSAAQALRWVRRPDHPKAAPRPSWTRAQGFQRLARNHISFYLDNLAEPTDPIEHSLALRRAAEALNAAIAIDFARR